MMRGYYYVCAYLEAVGSRELLLQHGLLHDAKRRGGGGGRIVAQHCRHQLRRVILRVCRPHAGHAR